MSPLLIAATLVLGGGDADGIGFPLSTDDAGRDAALGALYGERERPQGDGTKRSAGLGGSAPAISRWLGDIRRYFPSSVVQVMQHDALERLNMRDMLLQPEMLRSVQPELRIGLAGMTAVLALYGLALGMLALFQLELPAARAQDVGARADADKLLSMIDNRHVVDLLLQHHI